MRAATVIAMSAVPGALGLAGAVLVCGWTWPGDAEAGAVVYEPRLVDERVCDIASAELRLKASLACVSKDHAPDECRRMVDRIMCPVPAHAMFACRGDDCEQMTRPIACTQAKGTAARIVCGMPPEPAAPTIPEGSGW